MHLWCHLITQSIITLNILCPSNINSNLSAYAMLVEGQFDLNNTPMDPPGSKILIHTKPTKCKTWAPYSIDGWYIGPDLHHYRCFTT